MSDELESGTVLIQRYAIRERLAQGDFGPVYVARDLRFPSVKELLVVKEFTGSSSNPTMHELAFRNFERQADLLATLSHPAIPRVHDYFSKGERSYIALEYIEGSDTMSILDESEGFIPEGRIVKWAIGVCDALQYLHGQRPLPIIHRDVKPQHIIVGPSDAVHLVGFSIARIFQPGQKASPTGTQAYAAPEQFAGDVAPTTDIYALGATMHHLLTAHAPSQHPLRDPKAPVRSINPERSQGVEAIVERATQENPQDRFQSAGDMMLALVELRC